MLPATIKELSAIENIVGVKEATGNIVRGKEVIELCQTEDFLVYSGDDATSMALMLLGAQGSISVTANVAPKDIHQLCSLAMAGDKAGASQINDRLSVLNKCLFVESNPIPVKWALHEMGLINTGIRLPLTELDELFHQMLRSAMEQAGIL